MPAAAPEARDRGEAGEPPADRFAAIHGLFWLCANRAERGPLLVVVDDLRWLVDPSLAGLGYVARRAGDRALGLGWGFRSGDRGVRGGGLDGVGGVMGCERLRRGR